MNKPLDSRSAWQFGLATICVTAALFFFGNGLAPVWWLTWLAPLPALVLAPRVGKLAAFAVAFAGFSLGAFTWWTYLHRVLELPLMVFILATRDSVNFLRTWCVAYADVPAPWLAVACRSCIPSRVDQLRVSEYARFAAQHIWKSRVHSNEFPPHHPGRLDCRGMGNCLFAFSVSLERRRPADLLATG